MTRPLILALALILADASTLPAASTTQPARMGEFSQSFTVRSPYSDAALLATRHGWVVAKLKAEGAETTYDLSKESFEIRVPKDYDSSKKYGLLVWISASQSGRANSVWASILDKRHLIWIGANKAGNSRSVMARLGLALDAASSMKSIYSIDPDRIYVSGASGGGRCASMLGVSCPDVFHGGIYIIGCDYFREIPTGEPNKIWPRSYVQPSGRLFAFARQRSRHVLLTGDKDMNQPQTKANYELGFKRDGFEHVEYMQVPEMGHRTPTAEWFDKAVQFLDAPPASVPSPH